MQGPPHGLNGVSNRAKNGEQDRDRDTDRGRVRWHPEKCEPG